MIPISLHLKNFMSHDESSIEFDQLGSIIFIIGNEDDSSRKSNAVGKSTLFHAIKYSLFNASASKKINKVIREGAKKCELTFIFKMSNGEEYKIYRHRTEKVNGVNFYKKVDDSWEDITGRTASDTDQLIVSVIGVNLTTFENTSYFKQNDLMNLASATAEKRKQTISSMLELGDWKFYRETAKKKKDEYDVELSILKNKIIELCNPSEELLELKENHEQLVKDKDIYEKDIEKQRKLFFEKKEKLAKINNLITDKDQVERKYNDATLFLQETKDNLSFIKDSILDGSNELQKLNKTIDNRSKLATKKIKELTDLVSKTPDPVDLQNYESEQNKLAKNNVLLKENKALLKNLLKPLPSGTMCFECSTVLNEEKRTELTKNKKQQAKNVQEKIKEIENVISVCQENIKNIEKEIIVYNSYKNNNGQISNEISALNQEIKTYEVNIEKLNKRLESLREKEIKAVESLSVAQNSYDEIKTIKVSFMRNEHLEEIDNLKSETQKLNFKIKQLSEDLQVVNTELGRNFEKINQTEKKIEILKDAIIKKDELDHTIRLYDAIMFAFSTRGIPFMIINSVLDSIQEETNKVLKLLRNNMQTQFIIDKTRKDGEIQDSLDMKFFVDTSEWDYSDLSGGQQGSVALALKFAMAVVSRKRCGADIKMLLLDEVDQPLDEESVDAFYEILKVWSKDMTILVITHNKQLKEKLDRHILVKKKNGVSSASCR